MALSDSTGAPTPTRFPTKPRGKHQQHRLSALEVKNLRAAGRYLDGAGLHLEVTDTGAKHWFLRTAIEGKRREIGLGSALLIPLADAREEATRLRRIARAGGNPLLARRQARQGVPTFRTVATDVHEHHSKTFRNQKHATQWRKSLETYVFPVIGDRPVDVLEPRDVLEVLKPIWTTKPETARRVKQRIKNVFEWAKASGHRQGENPVEGVSRVLPKVSGAATHHAALPYAQLAAFLETLQAADASELARLAFEFLILTGTRTNEVRLARPEEIDRAAKTWTIPAGRMKAHVEHQVPLSPRCLEILERAEVLAGDSPYVFPGRWLAKPLSEMTFLMLLRRIKRDDITAHGFRSTFRDWAAERTTFPRAVVEAALAHVVKDKTEAAYLRTKFFEQRRDLMNTWAAFAATKSADVVSIRASRSN